MFRCILVPLDGSTRAESILAHLVPLASGAELCLFSCVELGQPPEVFRGASVEEADQRAARYLGDRAALLTANGVRVKTIVARGRPADAIVDAARSLPADLIAICTHGYSGVQRLLFGSVAEQVLLASPVPVLIGKARERLDRPATPDHPLPAPATRWSDVAVTLDGSARAEAVLDDVVAVALARNATVHLLHGRGGPGGLAVGEDPYRYLAAIAHRVEQRGVRATAVVTSGPVVQSILDYIETNGIGMVAITSHGRTGLARLVLGSVAMELVGRAGVPVLVRRAGSA